MALKADDFPQDILDQMMQSLLIQNAAFIKFENTSRGIFLSVLTPEDLKPKEPHCKTCQCSRVDSVPPSPDNSQSKSWHHGAVTKPSQS